MAVPSPHQIITLKIIQSQKSLFLVYIQQLHQETEKKKLNSNNQPYKKKNIDAVQQNWAFQEVKEADSKISKIKT